MVCPQCGSTNVNTTVNTNFKPKSRSFLWNALVFLILIALTILTGGIFGIFILAWILWMIIRKQKGKIVKSKFVICNNCGASWEVGKSRTF